MEDGDAGKLQALVYDILPWRKVPESDDRSVGCGLRMRAQIHITVHTALSSGCICSRAYLFLFVLAS